MPRPRFLKLDPDKQAAILDAARAEFSEHGYEAASQNRIIEAAGVSKGAMYYYFDDKNDLYITVIRREFADLGEVMQIGEVSSAADFWQQLEAMFDRAMAFMAQSPEKMALARSVARTYGRSESPPALRTMLDELYGATSQIVAAGQQVGAVRDDLPRTLLVGISMKIGEAMDLWFAEHWNEIELAELPDLTRKLIGVYQRVAAPE